MEIEAYLVIDTDSKVGRIKLMGEKKVNTGKLKKYLEDFTWVVEEQEIITVRQYRYMMAIFSDYSKTFGEDVSYYKEYLKKMYCRTMELGWFSCKSTTKGNARDFIDFIINKGLEWGVVFSIPPYKNGINVEKYVYKCLEKRVCAKCNKRYEDGYEIQLHHQVTVAHNGGRKFNDDNLPKISLCGECHAQAHHMGLKKFADQYKLVGVLYDSEKWYGKKLWNRLRKTQKYEGFLYQPEDDMGIAEKYSIGGY